MIAFVPFENQGISLLLPKLTYMFFNSLILAAALYKFASKLFVVGNILSNGHYPCVAIRLGGHN